ncbi:putative phage abortive infection protein [Chryseobacterium vrystaatense]|uniref:Phage abortive infection protein n=1 Tax=Chryseobacterium vrystaatense TaxID=307480 RepID=A0ABR4UFE7_9FLAO|nr:putative phage abortive infection protein [Chryseobacterium vrystaatense]KFF23255.1 hypothetical protein IW16_23445 [Chryseobacterium vrystaatense]
MKNGNWVFWTFGIGSVVFMGVTLYLNYSYAVKLGIQSQGLFGDMFGASNALFTGLSFVGVIIAILLQRQELKLQRNELELTRKEMEQTRDEFVTQNYTLKLQQFENTFFQMLKMLEDIVKRQKHSEINNTFTGEEVFDIMFKNFYSEKFNFVVKKQKIDQLEALYNREIVESQFNFLTKDEVLYIFNQANKDLYRKLMPYILHIGLMLKLLHDSSINNKQVYASILQSQLNDAQLKFILFNCLRDNVTNDFYDHVLEFTILKRETLNSIIDEQLRNDLEILQNKTAP